MGSIGGLLGTAGGAGGTGFAGPASTNILNGTGEGQLATAYGGAQNSLAAQQALLAAIQAQNGLGNQSQVYNQLQGVVNGTGPNPAQAMLANSTGANTANQAALMAGQRGAGANVGLLARQAAQQGSATQQNAIGQAAALQAQQSLGALGQAGNLANTQAANQIGATGANTNAQLNEQQILQNAAAAQNNAHIQQQANINNINSGLANTTMQGTQKIIGGLIGGAGAASGVAGTPSGPAPGGIDEAGLNSGQFSQLSMPVMGGGFAQGGIIGGGPQSSFGQFVSGMKPMAQGGNVGSQLKSGGHVPGKAKLTGNSYSNDNVKALLSPGELVVDRETMADGGPAGQAARFLAAVISAKKKGKK